MVEGRNLNGRNIDRINDGTYILKNSGTKNVLFQNNFYDIRKKLLDRTNSGYRVKLQLNQDLVIDLNCMEQAFTIL